MLPRPSDGDTPISELTLGALVDGAARCWPDRLAVEDGARRWSFVDLRDQARRVSRALIAEGLAHGERVAIWAPNSCDWMAFAIGAEQIGLAIVPLNTRFKAREAADILARSSARVLASVNRFLGQDLMTQVDGEALPRLARRLCLQSDAYGDWLAKGDGVEATALDRRIAAVRGDTPADVLFTSGTTGLPKGVVSSHAQNLRSFQAWSDAVGLRASDRYLIINPFFHTFGYKAGWLACLLRGATVLPVAVFDAAETLARIAADRVTVLPGPPTLYQTLLEHPRREAFDLSSLRLAVTGAANVPPSLIRRMHDELGIGEVLTAYGLTEACGVVTATRAGDPVERVAYTCGKPIPGVSLRIVDAEGRDLADGEPGELLVRGFNVMQGYLDDPAATAEAITPEGWLHTGDIAVRDAEGYLRITDRSKDLYICGGFNCYPAEIESLMLEHPGVARVAVVGVPDARMGEVGRAYVVARAGADIDAESFIAWCRGHMANYKAPRSVEVVADLPTNASGKVQRFLLRARAAPG